MSAECPSVERLSLGVYVLGVLRPGERREVEGHLARCTACREELAELAGLPALLARVPAEQVAAMEPPAPEMSVGLLSAIAHGRRSRRRRARLATALAAAAVAAAALFSTWGPEEVAPVWPTVVAAADGRTDVSARIAVRPTARGTALSMRMRGAPPGELCSLIAVSRDGRRETAADWRATYEGEAEVEALTTIPARELGSFEVVTASGRRLVGASMP